MFTNVHTWFTRKGVVGVIGACSLWYVGTWPGHFVFGDSSPQALGLEQRMDLQVQRLFVLSLSHNMVMHCTIMNTEAYY